MEQLRFEFALLPTSDGKSNICGVTSITTKEQKVFAIPEELQSVGLHKELIKTSAYNKVKNSLKKRHQTRRVWIKMSDELSKIYVDEEGNLQFGEEYLEEIEQKVTSGGQVADTQSLEKIFSKLIESTQEIKKQNLKYIAEKFVIDKFTSKNPNASQWIEMFEKECARFDITEDGKKIEILRLFMDKSCVDWYSSMSIKLTLDSDWTEWKGKFCDTFVNQGWNQVSYALSFKHREGSLVDYAIKKEKLILDMRGTIDTGTLVDLIAAGLPASVLEKINREEMKDTVDLFNEVRKYEQSVRKYKNGPYRKYDNQKINTRIEERTPCKTCEKLNKGVRYHPESACWFKLKEDDGLNRKFIRHVNNSVIEAELNETEQKN